MAKSEESESGISLSDREEDLRNLLARRMNDAAYSKVVYYEMQNKYEKLENRVSYVIIALAGFLTVGAVWEQIPVFFNFGLAVTTGVVSIFSTYADFDRQGLESEKAGDAYNRILKEFQEYYYFILKSEGYSFDEKKRELKRLLDKYDEINSNTLSTDDEIYNSVSKQDVMSTLETTDEEMEALLNDRNLKELSTEEDANIVSESEAAENEKAASHDD